ncbi:phosphoglycerate mutase [Dyella monticola]|uniref:Phosphoglycerate mutase n=1 Tax=Dyella monticola TaxID=1927958 RepID=A0A370WV60_9GAMM|nr:phosphoglycerate mutase [Dyella monticola]RDS79941.1 phosphoglycerate mutase [Dyella monticola]
MASTESRPLECWLPALQRFDASHPLRMLLQSADSLPHGSAGYLGGLASYFHCHEPLPAAALIRDYLCGDAGDACWLSADPAWVQPDMSGARLLACGQLPLSMDEAQALAEPLQPVFDEAGMALEVSSPQHWHLRVPIQTPLPDFAAPEQALGGDLYEHLPQGAEGRRWRVLFNEVQVLLHQHPLNAQRRERNVPPINSLWFWGGGVRPLRIDTTLRGVIGEDMLLRALAQRAGISIQQRDGASIGAAQAGWLIDLQDQPAETIASEWWSRLQSLSRRQPLLLAFDSGERWLHRPLHRLRFWRQRAR